VEAADATPRDVESDLPPAAAPADAAPPAPPRWAKLVALGLIAAALGVLVVGRGGTAVLAGVCLAFGAVAALLLSMPDRLPHEE
jgi:hypothetical protein